MKIRTGFVSNSSSSSFVLFYRPAKISELDDINVHALGMELNEGRDYLTLDKKTRKYLTLWLDENPNYDLQLVYEYCSFDEFEEFDVNELLTKLPKDGTITVECFNRDNYSTENFSDFKERYVNQSEDY